MHKPRTDMYQKEKQQEKKKLIKVRKEIKDKEKIILE